MFSAELARIISEDRERQIRDEVRLRALLASCQTGGKRRTSAPALRPMSQPARSR